MDTKLYHLQCQLTLKPIWHDSIPSVIVSLNEQIVYAGGLSEVTTFSIDQHLPLGNYDLTVEFTNKSDSDTDTANNKDKVVVVEKIVFNSIESPRFIWNGVYQPCYPEPWASEQQNLEPLLKSHNYLSWNGKWTLTFSVPIFTWIHSTEDLGWIYN